MILEDVKLNNRERMEFVTFWANYVRNTDDLVWSKQQNILINSNIKSFNLTKEQYLELKG